jgi:uncharacterized protein
MPEWIHVVLASGERRSLRVADFAAYHRRLRRDLVAALADGVADTYPEPVEHCSLCRWSGHCDGVREADDHLSLVARMGRPQIARLREVGIDSVAALAGASSADRPARVAEPTFERLRQQARLQVDQRETGCPYSF